MKKAIGYIRVSTYEQAQEGVSLSNQEAKIKAYAMLHDMELVQIIKDEGRSAKNIEGRPGAKRLLALTSSQAVNAVIVYKLDRLFRNTAEALTVATEFKSSGVTLHSLTESIDTGSAMGKFFFTIMAAVAEMERNLIAERTRDALRHKKGKGEVYGHVPYGLRVEGGKIIDEKLVGGKLVPHEGEQAVIGIAKKLREEGKTLIQIAGYLNEKRVPTKKEGKWHPKTVSSILATPIRSGN